MNEKRPEQYVFIITVTDSPKPPLGKARPRVTRPAKLRRSNGALDADAAQPADEPPHLEDADGGEDVLDR